VPVRGPESVDRTLEIFMSGCLRSTEIGRRATIGKCAGPQRGKSIRALLDRFGRADSGSHERTFWSSRLFLCSVGRAAPEILSL
jgi:hypothetical protein